MAKKALCTDLCDLLGIEYPIILAGMGAPQGDPLLTCTPAELVAAVSNAGGLGIIGATRLTPDELRSEIRKTKELTDKPFGVDVLLPTMVDTAGAAVEAKAELPPEHVAFVERLKKEIGIPEAKVERPVLTWDQIKQLLEVSFEEGISLFVSGLGNPGWVTTEAHARGIKVAGVVGNVKNARRLAGSGVDFVVAQGHEGGGHTGRIGSLVLIPQVVDAISPMPVVAAGGIGDGRGLVAALALGAVGIWCGTLFLATKEAKIHDFHRRKILEATDEGTCVTRVYTGKTLRTLKNKWIDTWEKTGMATLPYPQQGLLIAEALAGLREANLTDYLSGYTGQVSGIIKEIKPAKQVVEEMVEEAAGILERLPVEVLGQRQRLGN